MDSGLMRRHYSCWGLLRNSGATLLVLGMFTAGAQGATLEVDIGKRHCSDVKGHPFCTIQAAVNASVAGDVINISDDSYIEQITIDRNITLQGAGMSTTQGACDGVTDLLGSPPLTVLAGATVIVTGVTLKGGAFAPNGGGVSNAGTLTLLNSEVCQNSTYFEGGGIYTSGNLVLLNVQVYGNLQDVVGAEGGGLFIASGGSAIVTRSSITGNRVTRGGGISIAAGGSLLLENSSVKSNFADDTTASLLEGQGGGIYNAGFAILDQSEIGGFAQEGNAVLNPDGSGGGIYNSGQLLVTRSLIASNVIDYTPFDLIGVAFGAGLYNTGVASLVSSTVSGNLIQPNLLGYAAGIYNSGTLSLSNVTITNNSNGGAGWMSGAGVYTTGGSVTVRNSIIASQTAGDDCNTSITTDGFNIDSDGTCGLLDVSSGGTDHPLTDPDLLPLADNGGPTPTHNIPEDSPAIDAGNSGGCMADLDGIGTANVPLVSDQRGNMFADVPAVGGGVASCDTGAVEFNLLRNGMLEDDDDGDNIPDDWTGTALGSKDHLYCNPLLAHQGLCYFRFKGAAQTKQLVQQLNRSGSSGDHYAFSLYAAGINVTGSPQLKIQFDDSQTVGIDEEYVSPLPTGSYGYTYHFDSYITGVDYDTVTIIIESGAGGKLGVDDVNLVPYL